MMTKFRLYRLEPWRRKHAQGMQLFAKLARKELAAAKRQGRTVNIPPLYERLAAGLCGYDKAQQAIGSILTDAGWKTFCLQLVDSYPNVFTERIEPGHHAQALECIRQDIQASVIGPEAVIAFAVELEYGAFEAARYLLAVASGRTRRSSSLFT